MLIRELLESYNRITIKRKNHMSEKELSYSQGEKKEKEVLPRLETIIYFIRHGEAEEPAPNLPPDVANKERRLTKNGIIQAQKAGERIRDELDLSDRDIVFFKSSPASRALQTAEIVRAELLAKEGVKYQTGKTKKEQLYFREELNPAYDVGTARRGTSKNISEEWVRNPEIYQKDIEAAKLDGVAEDVLAERKMNFQNFLSIFNRASKKLYKVWESHATDEQTKEIKPPRLVILLGSHSGIVSESWLYHAIKDYEDKEGIEIPLELEKSDYFSINIPSTSDQSPVLNIGDRHIPLAKEHLERIRSSSLDESRDDV